MDWNDLKLFLAVARTGSIRAAAGELGVNQSTVNRRMDVLEHDLNLVLFDRSTRGLALTEHGRAVADAAAPMQVQSQTVETLAETLRRRTAGTLKITAPNIMSGVFVVPIIEIYRRKFPDVIVEYDASEVRLDLHAGEADVAFRAGSLPPDSSYAIHIEHDSLWSVYCSHGFAARHGAPRNMEELRRFPVVELGGTVGKLAGNQWFMSQVDRSRVAGLANSVPNMGHILHAGLGVGIMPVISAAQDTGLCSCFGPVPELTTKMWIVTTPTARSDPRIGGFVRTAVRWFADGNGRAIEQAAAHSRK